MSGERFDLSSGPDISFSTDVMSLLRLLSKKKYSITYGRKVRAQAYDMLEIRLFMEFTEDTPIDEAYRMVKEKVDKWIEDEREKIIIRKMKEMSGEEENE